MAPLLSLRFFFLFLAFEMNFPPPAPAAFPRKAIYFLVLALVVQFFLIITHSRARFS
jgi:hypothetical protein